MCSYMRRAGVCLVVAFAVTAASAAEMTVTGGLKLWLKADAVTGANDGDFIGSWPDSSGNGNTVSHTNTNRWPTYRANVRNGRPVVRFSRTGTADVLERADGLGFTGNPAMTVINVIKGPTEQPRRYFQVGGDSASGTQIAFCSDAAVRYNNGNRQFYNDTQTGVFSVGVWLKMAGDGYGDPRFFKNSIEATQTSASTANGPVNLVNGSTTVGAGLNSNGAYNDQFEGDVAELLVYNRVLTPSEINQVGYYLAEKYAINAAYTPYTVPADIAGLSLWLDAYRIGGVTPGQAVTRWDDLSVNESHATNGAAAGPVYEDNVVNSLPVASFTGSNSLFSAITAWPSTASSIFVVSKADNTSQVSRVLQAYPDNAFNRLGCRLPNSGSLVFDFGDSTGAGGLTVAFDGGTGFNIHLLRTEAGVGQSAGRNGMPVGSDLSAGAYAGTGKSLEIGGGGTEFFRGDIAEIIVYDRVLTGAETLRVGYYLEQKYGLDTVYRDPNAHVASYGGLKLWLDAAEAGGITNGAIPQAWHDLSGNEHHVTNAAGAPQWQQNRVNGGPAMVFDGTGAFLRSDDALGLSGSPAMTVVTVVKANAASPQRLLQLGALAGTGGQMMSFGLDGSVRYNDGDRLFDSDLSGGWHIGVWTRDAGDFYGDASLAVDGVAAGELSSSNPGSALALADEACAIGAGLNTSGTLAEFVDGEVAEILVYDRLLTLPEQNELGTRLAEKYAVEPVAYATAVDPADFAHAMEISFPGYQRSETLGDFPALIVLQESLDDFSFGGFVSTDGNDLRFADSTGTNVIFHEVEQWGNAGTNAYIWVRLPELRRGTTIKMYWGNAAIATNPPFYADGGVWDGDFLSVLHMNGSGTEQDATLNDVSPSIIGATNAPGVVGTAHGFDGDNDYLTFGDLDALDVPAEFTVSMLFKRRTNDTADASNHAVNNILIAQSHNSENDNLEIGTQGANVEFYIDDAGADGGPDSFGAGIRDNAWHHLVLSYDGASGTAASLYIDGSLVTAFDTGGGPMLSSDGSHLTVGLARPDNQLWGDFDGLMDEVRVSLTARSAAWVYAEAMTMRKNGAFTRYGTTRDPADFPYQMGFAFEGYDRAETLDNFTALVKFREGAGFNYGTFASPDAADLRFLDATSGEVLAYDIEKWDTNGTSYVWVQLPELETGTTIGALWGNADDVRQPYVGDGAWVGDYQSVYHLDETTGTHSDLSLYGRDLVVFGNYEQDAAGVIDGGAVGSGGINTDRLEPLSPSDPFYHNGFTRRTVSAWVTLDSTEGPNVIYEQGGTTAGLSLAYRTTISRFILSMTGGSAETEIAAGTRFRASYADPIHVAATFDGGAMRLYVDGELDANGNLANALAFHTSNPGIGGSTGDSPLDLGTGESQCKWHGLIDEVRQADAARSADWIWAAYANVGEYDTFVAEYPQLAAEESTLVTMSSARANGTLAWTTGATMNVTMYWGTSDAGATAAGWGNTNALGPQAMGAFSADLSNLVADMSYTYRFFADDGGETVWSDAVSFHTLFTDIPGMSLWVSARAVTGVSDGGALGMWRDLSGNGNDLRQADGAPLYVADAGNGRPVVRFSGTNDTFYNFDRITDIRTVFWVLREDADATGPRFLLGDVDTYHFHRGLADPWQILHPSHPNYGVAAGNLYVNGGQVDGTATTMPTSMSVVALVTAGDAQAGNLSDDRGIGGRSWDGDVAELIIFNRALSADELNEIGTYLDARYGIDTAYEKNVVDPGAFANRMKVAFDGYTGGAALTDFPALVRLGRHIGGFDYSGFVSPGGMDIRFADATGTNGLSFEIDQWDTNGTSTVWVRVPQLDAATEIWAYWGNAVAATNLPTDYGVGAWDPHFDAVWHLGSGVEDSTVNAIDGVASNTSHAEGMISGAAEFDGFSSSVNLGDDRRLEHANGITVSAWIRPDALSGVQHVLFKNPGWAFGINNNVIRFTTFTVKDYQSTAVLVEDRWQHVACRLTGGNNVRFYLDGEYIGNATHTAPGTTGTSTAYLGRPDLTRWDGAMDDVRIAGTERTDAWIKASYDTVANNTAFSSYQMMVTADGVDNVASTTADLRGTLHFSDGSSTDVTLYLGTSDGGASEGGWTTTNALGSQAVTNFVESVAGLAAQATYTFRFYATNATGHAWSGAQVFRTPIDGVGGTALWLDADEIGGRADGDALEVWHDLSGNANHALQLQPDMQPEYAAAALGGEPAVRFADGETMALPQGVTAQGGTLFIVHRQSPLQGAWTSPLGGDLRTTQDDQEWALERAAGGTILIRPQIPSTTFSVNVLQLVQNDYRMWVNGELIDTSASGNVIQPFDGVGVDFIGDISEVILFDRELSLEEQNSIGLYLAGKYALATGYEPRTLDPGAFAYKAAVTYGYDKGDTLTNFPAFVRLDAGVPNFAPGTFASPQGYDLRFADDAGRSLNYEVEKWLRHVPVAYYTFEGAAEDVSTAGNDHDAALVDNAGYTNDTPSGAGQALDLSNTNGASAIVPDWQGIGGRGARTVSAWISTTSSDAAIASWGEDAAGEKWIFRVQTGNGQAGAIRVEVNGGYRVGGTIVNDGAWHHVACVLQGGSDNINELELYVDGALETPSATQGVALDTDANAGLPVRIGQDHSNRQLQGLIDELSIWDVALTPAQLAAIYNGGTPLDVSAGISNGGEIEAWVQVPAFTNNTRIWALWGNPSDVEVPLFATHGSPWNDDFEAVWHLSTPDAQDSTRFLQHGARAGDPQIADGLAYDALTLDGTGDRVSRTVSIQYPAYSVSAWARARVMPDHGNDSVFNNEGTGNDFQWDNNAGSYRCNGVQAGSTHLFGPVVTNGWVQLFMTADGVNTRLYYNGQLVDTYAAHDNNFSRYEVGCNRGRNHFFDGDIEEMRVMDAVASPNWVWATYMNLASNGTFGTYDAVQGAGPEIQNQPATLLTDTGATLNASLTVSNDTATTVYALWGTTDGGGAWGAWDNTNMVGAAEISGPVALVATGLTAQQAYHYAFHASNGFGEAWAQPSTMFTTLGATYYAITPSAGPNGSISPAVAENVNPGAGSLSYTFQGDTGYHLTNVVVDGTNQGALASYQFTNVQTNHTIQALFGINMYTITVAQVAGGAIAPDPASLVAHGGDSEVFAFTPDRGHYLSDIIADGVSQGPLASYAFEGVTENRSLTAEFTAYPDWHFPSNSIAFWIAADSLDSGDGDPVDKWFDLTARGGTLTQPSALLQPRYVADGINGHPAVLFDGTERMTNNTVGAHWPTSNTTVFVVMRSDPVTQSTIAFAMNPNLATNRFLAHLPWGGTAIFDFGDWAAAGRIQAPSFDAATNAALWSMRSEYAVGQSIELNGSVQASDNTSDDFLLAGQHFDVGMASLQGHVAELLVFNGALDVADTARVGHYLQEKYGIAGTFPSPHSLDLALTVTTDAVLPRPGIDSFDYTVTVVNNGPTNASGVAVTDVLPSGVSYVSHTGGGYTNANGIWGIGALDYLASTTLTITVSLDTGTGESTITNRAWVSAVNESDYDGSNNTNAVAVRTHYEPVDPAAYARKMDITFPGFDKAETLTNFPALVKLSESIPGFRYDEFASPHGADLVFTETDGKTVLSHDVESWDVAGTSYVWVRVPAFTNGATIQARWGHSAALEASAHPTDIASCVLWMDAADADTLTLQSTDVRVWGDKSGNGNDAAQALGHRQPEYVPGALNGNAVVAFDGADGLMTTATNLIGAGGDYTKIVVARFNQLTIANNLCGSDGANGHTFYLASGSAPVVFHSGVAEVTSTREVAPGRMYLLVGSSDGTTASVYVDGRHGGSAAVTSNFVDEALQIGWHNGGNFLDGDIAEVIVYDRQITDGERRQLEVYLGEKYALDVGRPEYTWRGDTWQQNFVGVLHLDGDGTDATANSFDGSLMGTAPDAGPASGALSFDGTNDAVNLADVPPMDAPLEFTTSLWFKRRVEGGAGSHTVHNVLVSKGSTGPNDNLEFGTSSTNIEFYIDDGNPDGNPDVIPGGIQHDTWQYIALAYDGTASNEALWYVDGQLVNAFDTANNGAPLISSAGSPLGLGMSRVTTSQNGDFNGLMDEFRLSLAQRSSNWIWACWMNQNPVTQDAFVNTGPAGGAPDIESLPPTMVGRSTATFQGTLSSTGGAPTQVWLYYGTSDGGDDRGAWGATNALPGDQIVGPVSVSLTTLTPNTQYHYRYFASNAHGMAWSDATPTFRTAAAGEYVIEAVSGGNGAIVPSGLAYVSSGGDSSNYTFQANAGQALANVLVDGSSVGTPANYQLTGVVTDHTIRAEFAAETYVVSVTQTTGGTITPGSPAAVARGGSSEVLSIRANLGYRVADVLVDGHSIGPAFEYQFINVTNARSIEASFAVGPAGMNVSSGIVLWLAADALDATNGQDVALWQDLSGNGRHLYQAEPANRPVLSNDVVNGIAPAVSLPLNRFMGRDDALGFSGDPALSVVAVVRGPATGNRRYIHFGAIAANTGRSLGFGTDASVRYNDGNVVWAPRQTGEFSIGVWTRNAFDQHNAPLYYNNGGLGTFVSSDNTPPNLIGLRNEETLLGRGRGTTGAPSDQLEGDMAELLVFDRVLTAAEQRQIGRYLAAKYDIETGYSPELLPGGVDDPVLWLAARHVTTATNGQPIATWYDLSGHGHNVVQATTGIRPTYAIDLFNGLPAMRFDGNDYLRRTDALGLANEPAMTVFFVADVVVAGDTRILHMGATSGADTATLALTGESSARYNGGNRIFANDPLSGGVNIGMYRRAQGATYGAIEFWKNGTAATQTAAGSPTKRLTGWANGETIVGAGRASNGTLPSNILQGDVAEILVYNRALSDGDSQRVTSFLQSRYKLTGTLIMVR
jgi:uncharacterized repeat protein (TIGR01451 family)